MCLLTLGEAIYFIAQTKIRYNGYSPPGPKLHREQEHAKQRKIYSTSNSEVYKESSSVKTSNYQSSSQKCQVTSSRVERLAQSLGCKRGVVPLGTSSQVCSCEVLLPKRQHSCMITRPEVSAGPICLFTNNKIPVTLTKLSVVLAWISISVDP